MRKRLGYEDGEREEAWQSTEAGLRMKVPDWWPPNPYPRKFFPATAEEIRARINDDHLMTAALGPIGRFVFEGISRSVLAALEEKIGEVMDLLEGSHDAGAIRALEILRELYESMGESSS